MSDLTHRTDTALAAVRLLAAVKVSPIARIEALETVQEEIEKLLAQLDDGEEIEEDDVG